MLVQFVSPSAILPARAIARSGRCIVLEITARRRKKEHAVAPLDSVYDRRGSLLSAEAVAVLPEAQPLKMEPIDA